MQIVTDLIFVVSCKLILPGTVYTVKWQLWGESIDTQNQSEMTLGMSWSVQAAPKPDISGIFVCVCDSTVQ